LAIRSVVSSPGLGYIVSQEDIGTYIRKFADDAIVLHKHVNDCAAADAEVRSGFAALLTRSEGRERVGLTLLTTSKCFSDVLLKQCRPL
jgi:ketosteroid isomerase-like protein